VNVYLAWPDEYIQCVEYSGDKKSAQGFFLHLFRGILNPNNFKGVAPLALTPHKNSITYHWNVLNVKKNLPFHRINNL
jgi:hypothetical protein